MKKNIPLLLFLLCALCSLHSQNRNIDSLKKLLTLQETGLGADTFRINTLNKISRLMLFAGSYDSSLHYATRSLHWAERSGDSPAVKRGLGRAYNSIGLVHYYKGNYPEALAKHFMALKIQEEVQDKFGIASSYNHIGLVHYNQGHYDEALRNHEASLRIKKEINDKQGIIASYVNMGNIYHDKGDLQQALKCYYAGVNAAEKTGDKQVMGTCYNNIGSAYLRMKNYNYAIHNYKKAFEVRQGTGDKYGDAMSYSNLSDVYYQMGEYREAKSYAIKSLDLANGIGALELIKAANSALSNAYDKLGDPVKALKYYKAYIQAKDSLLNEESTRKSVETQMQFEFDKRAAADSIKAAEEKKVVAARLDQERTTRLALFGGLFLLILFALFMINRFRVTMRQKNIIEMKEKHAQHQKQIIAHQKDLVEGKQKEILDSINYAQRIQRALLANESLLNLNLRAEAPDSRDVPPQHGHTVARDYFILFRPKDIVSGDFYWASQLPNGEFALAIGDSTGHGVPGAIMSILNITCLNEAVSRNVIRPDQILFEARRRVIEHLKNDGSLEGGKDGMDCSLLTFNFKTNVLSYSGANNPLWIIRNSEVVEVKPDKMPVGKHERDHEAFTLHSLALQKGDMIYAFTDGYADQFGGLDGKKFMTKKFKNLLMSIASKPVAEQKRILAETFDRWKTGLEQVDDVTVFGLCVG